jgi:ferredoxin
MADASSKTPGNVGGKYYVDDTCSGCQVCIETAPNNFKMDDDEEYAFVFKQPENDEEREACEESVENCPEEAIGNDG